ncbi:MAG: STAS domain-containing protein [Candidatus Riflebacteria bacterium]|nr:STAS domain-containing protein [Candidatus Riflebacteria bacterium]
MEEFVFSSKIENQIVIIEASGYFEAIAGNSITQEIVNHLKAGKIKFLLDFTRIRVISSPGVAALMHVALRIQDDFRGKLVLVGLDKLKKTVLKMAGIIPIASSAETVNDGIVLLSSSQS